MPRNTLQQSHDDLEDRYPRIHPIWRGVGFVFMIVAPIIAFTASGLILDENAKQQWVKIPPDLIIQWQGQSLDILVKLIITIFLTLVAYAIFTLAYFLIVRVVAPPRYGPFDVPPVTYKGKPYKR